MRPNIAGRWTDKQQATHILWLLSCKAEWLTSRKIRRITIAICNDSGQLHYPFKSFLPPCSVLISLPLWTTWLLTLFGCLLQNSENCRIMKAWFITIEYIWLEPLSPDGGVWCLVEVVLERVTVWLTDVSWNVPTEFQLRRWYGNINGVYEYVYIRNCRVAIDTLLGWGNPHASSVTEDYVHLGRCRFSNLVFVSAGNSLARFWAGELAFKKVKNVVMCRRICSRSVYV